MNTAQIITIAGNAASALITFLVLIGVIVSGNFKERLNRIFAALLIINFIGSICEGFVCVLYSLYADTMRPAIVAVELFDYTIAAVLLIEFAQYLYIFLSSRVKLSKTPFIVISCLGVLNVPLVAVQGIDLSFAGVQLASKLPLIAAVITAIIILRHSRRLRTRECVSLLLYVVIPLLFIIAQLIYPDLWLIWLGIGISFAFIHMNIHIELQMRIREHELELAESRTATTLSQIQPHFLINTLLNMESLCHMEGAERAEKVARNFSDYLGGNLRAMTEKNTIPFMKELEHTKQYLAIAQVRFEDKLRVEFDIKESGFTLPALTLQPLVENAVWHGVCNRENGGTVTIRAEETPDCYRVVIADDGVGFDPKVPPTDGRRHIGIENVRCRMEIMCGGNLCINSTPGIGTEAVLTIPKGVRK